MSIKENVDFVKDELNSEEKFIESFVKVERFYKKYKTLIFALLGIVIVAVIAITVKANMDEKNKLEANLAFDKILANPQDEVALATLKDKNKNLYGIAMYLSSNAQKAEEVNTPFLKELAKYEVALKNKSLDELNNLSMQNDFLLKEFAIFNKALFLTNEKKYVEAKAALALIPQTSKAYELANLLNHYLLTK